MKIIKILNILLCLGTAVGTITSLYNGKTDYAILNLILFLHTADKLK